MCQYRATNEHNIDVIDILVKFLDKIQELDVNSSKHHKLDKNNIDKEVLNRKLEQAENFIVDLIKNKTNSKKVEIDNYMDLMKPTDNINVREENLILKDKLYYLNKENNYLK